MRRIIFDIRLFIEGVRFTIDLQTKGMLQLLGKFRGLSLRRQLYYYVAAAIIIDDDHGIIYDTYGLDNMIYVRDKMEEIVSNNVNEYYSVLEEKYGEEVAMKKVGKVLMV